MARRPGHPASPGKGDNTLIMCGIREIGWGTWIRTKIDGVRVRSSTVELSPNGFGRWLAFC